LQSIQELGKAKGDSEKEPKMTSRLFSSLLIILVLCGCSKKETTGPTQPQPPGEITNGEYAVLAAIIDTVYFYATDSTLVVQDTTSPGVYTYNIDSTLTELLQYVGQHVTALKAETMENFKAKNLTHTYIQNPSSICLTCVLSSMANTAYPVIEVSRVGFSSDGQQALTYVGFTEAPLVGAGNYYVLSQEHGKWVIIGSVGIWIS
jgi:hypothetical protein